MAHRGTSASRPGRSRLRVGAAAAAAAALLATGCDPGGSRGLAGGEDFSIRAALGELPAAALAEDSTVHVGDLVGAADAVGIDLPDPSDARAWVSDGLVPLTGGGESPPPVFVPWTLPPSASTPTGTEEVEDELGWSPAQIESFVEVESRSGAPTQKLTVLSGSFDDGSFAEDLVDLGDGVVSAGDGDDGEVDLANRSAARPLGAPLRMARQGDRIATSGSTDLIRTWLDEDPTLADDDALAPAVEVLDDADAVSAMILPAPPHVLGDDAGGEDGPPLEGRGDESDDLLPDEPFTTVGVGWAVEDGEGRVILTYRFDRDEDAQAALPVFERQWADGASIRTGAPLADQFTVVEARVDGPLAIVVLTPAENGHAATMMSMLIEGEMPFVSR